MQRVWGTFTKARYINPLILLVFIIIILLLFINMTTRCNGWCNGCNGCCSSRRVKSRPTCPVGEFVLFIDEIPRIDLWLGRALAVLFRRRRSQFRVRRLFDLQLGRHVRVLHCSQPRDGVRPICSDRICGLGLL